MSSVSGTVASPGQTNYAASKAGIIALTQSLSSEVARFDVQVNAVAPGFIATDMVDSMPEPAKKGATSGLSLNLKLDVPRNLWVRSSQLEKTVSGTLGVAR